MALSNRCNGIVLQQATNTFRAVKFDVTLGTEGGIGSNGDTELMGLLDKSFLSEVGVDFDLENGGLDSCIAQNV